jgi:PKD repeat protein/photosystem II stability/assembly factor-like uncharacterized protein
MDKFRNAIKMVTVILFLLGIAGKTIAQITTPASSADSAHYPYWIRMMQDPNANYYAAVSAFNKYWQDRPVTKGCGWKVFKRWEYIMRGRIARDGTKPAPDAAFNAWKKYPQNNRSSSGNWLSLGPSTIPSPGPAGYEGLGRLNVIAFHPANQNKIYVGAPSGGFWFTNDNGLTWSTSTDNLPTIGISAIAVDFANPGNILMGTGDRDHGDAPGMGVFKSLDGGLTWSESKTGMGNVTVCKIVQHPLNSMIFLAATTGGIFRTTNGGGTWTVTQTGNFNDICLKPDDPAIVYAASDANFFRSSDNGLSFVQVTSGLITGQRGAIAVSSAGPDYVYFLQSADNSGFQGLYRSTDAGLNFTTRSTTPNILDWSCNGSGSGGQGWYDLSIAADPLNAEIVYVGGVDVWKSINGGTTWTINSHWYGGCNVPAVHADCHFLGFSPVNGRLYAGNDGGIYYTSNGGTNWTDCTVGMTIGQIYKLGQSQTDANKTINGFQDNGTYTNLSTGWIATGGGDGMECAVDYQDASNGYFTIYYGDIYRTVGLDGSYHLAGNGVFGIDESGDWVTPFILDETDPKIMFVGYKNVWKCSNVRLTPPVWTKISDGETDNCYVLEQSPANINIIYVVRSGNMQRTENANDASPVWISCALPGGETPSDLEAHPTEPNTVYATAYNKVYKSTDKGATWNLMPGALPDVPINTIVYDKNSTEGIYIGTQVGALYKNPTMSDWTLFSTGLPVVDVRELEIYYNANPANNKIMAATFGRGLWKSDLFAATSAPVANFSVSPAVPCQFETVQLTDRSMNFPNAWSWSFSPATVTYVNATNSNSQNPQVQFNQKTSYMATLLASNAIGSSSVNIPVSVGGIDTPFSETFESGTFPVSWTIINPDGATTWQVATTGGNGTSTKSAFMNFVNYYPPGPLDDMITAPVKLAGTLHPWLKFKVAYRQWGPGYSDGLKVFISTDCGVTWGATPVYDKSGTTLATGPDQQDLFIPSASSDWRLDSVDMSPYNQSYVKIKFQAVNGWGNSLYIDDVTLADQPVVLLQNLVIPYGQADCFDSRQTITVAGGGTFFTVQNGGSATMIAGGKILYEPGTLASHGCYMHGYISPGGPYCGTPVMQQYGTGEEEARFTSSKSFFKVYPNPTAGFFTLELTGSDPTIPLQVEIYSSKGNKVFSRNLGGNLKYDLSLAGRPAGLYFIRIVSKENMGSVKIVCL